MTPDEFLAVLGGSPGGGCCDVRLMARILAAQSTTRYYLDRMQGVKLTHAQEIRNIALSMRTRIGLHLEFGVYSGSTLRQIATAAVPTGLEKPRVYGFDSFEGLPENWQHGTGKGLFGGAKIPDGLPDNVELVIGWFSDTLPKFLLEHPGAVSFLHIDCDVYSSTRDVLTALAPRIGPGTMIVFDEYFNYPCWEQHEFRAWQEFVRHGNVAYDYVAVNPHGQQVAVQVQSNRLFSP